MARARGDKDSGGGRTDEQSITDHAERPTKKQLVEWYSSLTQEQRESLREEEDREELKRWHLEGGRPPPARGTTQIATFVADSFARSRRLRALGVPEGLKVGEIARRAEIEEQERRYQKDVMRPLLKKARTLADALSKALRTLGEAEAKRPEEEHRRRDMHFYGALARMAGQAAPNAGAATDAHSDAAPGTEPPEDATTKARSEDQRIKFMLSISRPERMRAFLPYLVAILDYDIRKAATERGRPRNLKIDRVEQALREQGLSDRAVSLVLRSEGLETWPLDGLGTTDAVLRAELDGRPPFAERAREQVRARRRRRASIPGRKQTM